MSESKHTPLRIRDANASAGEVGTIASPAAFVVEDSCGDVRAIVTLSAVETRSGEEAKRYALECAAAPEMLEALRRVVLAWGHQTTSPTIAEVRAAIRKATGGEQ